MANETTPALITDSGASMLPGSKEADALNVRIVPLSVIFDGEPPMHEGDITPDEFYRRMATVEKLPTTSAPNINEFATVYQEAIQAGQNKILSLHISRALSGTCGIAEQAAQSVMEENPEADIRVVDTQQISAGMQPLVELAARYIEEGLTLDQVEQRIRDAIDNERVGLIAILKTMDNAIRGGRISALKGAAASLLRIKPILKMQNGKLEVTGQIRTWGRAKQRLIDTVGKLDVEQVAILHTNSPEEALTLKAELEEIFGGEIEIHEAGTAIAVHAGPGALGVAYLTREP